MRTIAEFGGEKLGKLGSLELEDEFGEKVPFLISFLRGERTKYKYKVLDLCLKFIPLHWKKSDGEPYEPSSITTYGKYISSILKQENVHYSVETEFKRKGEFHAVLQHIYEENRTKNPSYGSKKREAFMDPNADAKVEKALRNGILKPYHNYVDMVKVVLFCLTRFFCLRGGEELCQALIEHFRVGTYLDGPDRGLKKIEYVNECYKHRYLTLGRCYLSNKGYPEIREMKEDTLLHPFRFIQDFLSLQRPTGSGRLFVRATRETECLTEHQCKSGIRPILTRSHYGVQKIRGFWKELVIDCGFIMPERNKPHGGRSLATTTMISQNLPAQLITKQMRHASEATLKS